jgi:hypothetical protein
MLGFQAAQGNCSDNLRQAMAGLGYPIDHVPCPLNLFENAPQLAASRTLGSPDIFAVIGTKGLSGMNRLSPHAAWTVKKRNKSVVRTQHSKVRLPTWSSNGGMLFQEIGSNYPPIRNEGLQLHSLPFRIFSDVNHSSKGAGHNHLPHTP